MFKKIKKFIKKDIAEKNRKITKDAFDKALKHNKQIVEEIRNNSHLTGSNLGARIKEISTTKLKLPLVSNDETVFTAIDEGHNISIQYIIENQRNDNLDEIVQQASDIGYKEALVKMYERERVVNRLRITAIAILVFVTMIIFFH